MKKTFCDICGELIEPGRSQTLKLEVSTTVGGTNPMGPIGGSETDEVEFDDTCKKCRHVVALAIAKAISERVSTKS